MKLLKDEDGQAIVVFAAVMAIVALGFLAFAVDIGSLFRQKRMAQAAADAVAVAAAENVANSAGANEQGVANAIAKMNGFDTTLANNPARVTLATPQSGNFVGSSYVQATVSKPVPTLFLGAFSSTFSTMTVSAQAIAGGNQSSQTCVCLEGQTGQDLTMSNGSALSATGCGVIVNSISSNAIGMIGGATLSAQTLGTVASNWNDLGNINNGAGISVSTLIMQGLTSQCAPVMPIPPIYSNCVNDPGGGSTSFTAGPSTASGVICYKALTIGANASLETLNPGTYVITSGSLHFENGSGGHSNVGGNGVFFYLTGTASLVIDNGANVNLVAGGNAQNGGGTAPTVGSYNGNLIYQDPLDTAAMSIQGGATAYLNGALYAPSAAITLGNKVDATINGGIVAASLTMNGGGILAANSAANEGSLSYGASAKLVQ